MDFGVFSVSSPYVEDLGSISLLLLHTLHNLTQHVWDPHALKKAAYEK